MFQRHYLIGNHAWTTDADGPIIILTPFTSTKTVLGSAWYKLIESLLKQSTISQGASKTAFDRICLPLLWMKWTCILRDDDDGVSHPEISWKSDLVVASSAPDRPICRVLAYLNQLIWAENRRIMYFHDYSKILIFTKLFLGRHAYVWTAGGGVHTI